MCGIVGLWCDGGVDVVHLESMSLAVAHRGPDDAGVFVCPDRRVGLAHRRLSIIDLSQAGHQPMSTPDGSLTITFNGEIYNFGEIRARLQGLGCQFRSRTDTEVILFAYERWGADAVGMFRGMFAFAIWDARRRRLFCARDQTGIKPFFYYWDGRTFAFASELDAFRQPGLDRSVDPTAIFDYLTYLRVPTPKTAYRRIAKLPAGHHLEFDGSDVRVRQYWDVCTEPDRGLVEPKAIEAVAEAIHDAVRLSLVADVPIGVFLSGGLDSSVVVAEASSLSDRPLATYSIGFESEGFSETDFARQVAIRFGTAHHERVLPRSSIRRLLPQMAALYGEPFADGSAMPTHEVSAMARADVKVVLSGDGGDEVFAGYRWYGRALSLQRYARLPRALRHHVLGPIGRCWPRQARGTRVKRFLEDLALEPFEQHARQMELFSPREKRSVLRSEWCPPRDYDDYWNLRQHWRPDLDPVTRFQYLDLKTYLPDDILTKVDRASMRVALEVRPPLLDPPLVELAFRVPAAVRVKDGVAKHLLKAAVGSVLPPAILSRGKQGFSAPLMDWMRQDRGWAAERLAATSLFERKALDRLSGHLWGPKAWALLILEQAACGF